MEDVVAEADLRPELEVKDIMEDSVVVEALQVRAVLLGLDI
jgi:hypothetical protein